MEGQPPLGTRGYAPIIGFSQGPLADCHILYDVCFESQVSVFQVRKMVERVDILGLQYAARRLFFAGEPFRPVLFLDCIRPKDAK